MIIDRHNYEECFILYWDDELTASQKQAVENFVKENADLIEEFEILGQTRFTPEDDVQFEEKEFLLNNSFINITNHEEQFLNYIDDELTAKQRKEIEKFVSQYPAVQQELALLQKTKLQPEAEIVFPDKAILYRKEEKVRVISMTWFRVAVAAAIILIAGFATFRLVNTNNSNGKIDIAKGNEIKNQPANQSTDKQTPNNDQPDVANVKPKTDPVQSEKKNQKTVIKNSVDNTIASHKPQNKNNLSKEGGRINQTQPNQLNSTEEIFADASNVKRDLNKVEDIQSEKINKPFENNSVTKSATPTFANISDESDHFGKEKSDKDGGGIKEFLRKTTRVFERRTRIQTTTDDNKLLVGAFAVSLK